ncbi:hypothetical protein LTR94_035980, partial [Friedmanniomyces endolithicus]
ARRRRHRAGRRYAVRTRHDPPAGTMVRRPADRRGGGRCPRRQPREPGHPLAGDRIYHRAEPGTPRAGRLRCDDGGARRGRRMAARGAGR